MTLQEVISWYQKKIGTYDKQQWEKTVEQRILHGITHVPTKTTKLKTDLIDVDLVRGSSFPKAKPKHGLVTVTRLAFQRLCLLPLYSEWWAQQTSPRLFALLLLIYVLQLFNLLVFTVHSCMLEADSTEHVSSSEIFVPIIMMIVLSIMHSQIVSTNPGPIKTPLQRNRRGARRRRRGVASLRSRSIIDNKSPDIGSVDSDKAIKYLNRVHMRNSEREIKMNKTGTSIRRRKVGWESPVRIGSTKSSPEAQESIKNILETEIISKVVPASTSKEDSLEMFSSVIRRNSSVYSQETSYDRESSKLIDKKTPSKRVRANMKVKEDDDGFESNGNGSSENGDDSPSKNANVKQNDKSKDSSSDTNTSNIKSTLNKCQTLAEEVERVQTEKLNNEFSSVLENNLCAILNDNKVHKIFHVNEVNLSTPFQNAWVNEVLENRSPGILLRESHSDNMESDADTAAHVSIKTSMSTRTNSRRRASQTLLVTSNSQSGAVSDGLPMESSGDTEEEGDCETVSSPGTTGSCCALHAEVTTSATEWIGITTNSEECSYSSEMDETDSQHECNNGDFVDHPFAWEFGSNVILGPSCAASDRVSCTIWERRDVKKADLSVLDISSAIIARVETMPETLDYFYCGIGLSVLLSVLPFICRIGLTAIETNVTADHLSVFDLPGLILLQMSGSLITLMQMAFGSTIWEQTIMIVSLLIRMVLSLLFFFLMAIAERIFKQRFLYAKLFSHLTSSRRARKSDLPHFRLNKVRNIKTWLSVRSYLKKRGPQRSVDVIVSAAFIITLLLLSFLSVELLRDSVHLHTQYNLEALVWSLSLGMFLLRFMTLGTKINRKFRNLSVLITEQINMYLQIEQKPHKKDELMVANSVLKLAADLLKELECPFKISGLSANPFLYTITKVVILSALSGVLSEMLGFKLKLHKIKIK